LFRITEHPAGALPVNDASNNEGPKFDAKAWRNDLLRLSPWLKGVKRDEKDEAFRAARKDACLKRHAQGREAWNGWAEAMLVRKSELERAGKWKPEGQALSGHDGDLGLQRLWLAAARADFSGHGFGEEADFSGFIFPLHVDFDKVQFAGNAAFGRAQFSGYAEFNEAQFAGDARFGEARFAGDAWFDEAQFSGDAEFTEAQFSGLAWFGEAQFTGPAWFDKAKFSGNAVFKEAKFSGLAWFTEARFSWYAEFDKARFSGNAWFHEAQFAGDAVFAQANFQGAASFDKASFAKVAGFAAIRGETAFSLAGAHFQHVPDFIQAHFEEAPRLDYMSLDRKVEPGGLWRSMGRVFRADVEKARDLSARYRALKRLAIQGHDHEREQMFFKGELRARRGGEDRFLSWRLWFGLFYELLSDFGGSVVRPFLWWVAATGGFAWLYLAQHFAVHNPAYPTGVAGWLLSTLKGWVVTVPNPTDLACLAGDRGHPLSAPLLLSVKKGLLVLGFVAPEKLNQTHACLYGVVSGDNPAPAIPDAVAFAGIGQTLISAVLIFLMLLAIRNHFRIK
jgi:uncharacterized protein YjbI with pentapeptide repeats